MSEEKKEQQYPEAVAGAIIHNDRGEILLTRSPKWGEGELWVIPGSHIEMGETAKEALRREVKEEVGLIVDSIEFLIFQDGVYPEDFHKKKHFIFLNFSAKAVGGELTKSDEASDFIWIEPFTALKTLKIEPCTIHAIQSYLNHKKLKEEDYKDKYLRALADYQNLLKQTVRDKEEFAKYANEQFILEILPIYDNLKLARKHADASASSAQAQNNAESLKNGVSHIINQFSKALKDAGVEEIETVGKKFDHNMMEAVESEGTDDKKKDGLVARELAAGYKLNGKVIKAARVIAYKLK